MSLEQSIRELAQRAQITDLVTAYATAVDTRDWDLFRSLFTERLFLDFRSFQPDLYRDMPFDELLEITKKLAAFTSTQHAITNHRVTLNGERATCIAYTQAGHFMTRDGEDHACFLYGYYTYEFTRSGESWKIDRYGLQVTAQQGDPRVFEWAGLL